MENKDKLIIGTKMVSTVGDSGGIAEVATGINVLYSYKSLRDRLHWLAGMVITSGLPETELTIDEAVTQIQQGIFDDYLYGKVKELSKGINVEEMYPKGLSPDEINCGVEHLKDLYKKDALELSPHLGQHASDYCNGIIDLFKMTNIAKKSHQEFIDSIKGVDLSDAVLGGGIKLNSMMPTGRSYGTGVMRGEFPEINPEIVVFNGNEYMSGLSYLTGGLKRGELNMLGASTSVSQSLVSRCRLSYDEYCSRRKVLIKDMALTVDSSRQPNLRRAFKLYKATGWPVLDVIREMISKRQITKRLGKKILHKLLLVQNAHDRSHLSSSWVNKGDDKNMALDLLTEIRDRARQLDPQIGIHRSAQLFADSLGGITTMEIMKGRQLIKRDYRVKTDGDFNGDMKIFDYPNRLITDPLNQPSEKQLAELMGCIREYAKNNPMKVFGVPGSTTYLPELDEVGLEGNLKGLIGSPIYIAMFDERNNLIKTGQDNPNQVYMDEKYFTGETPLPSSFLRIVVSNSQEILKAEMVVGPFLPTASGKDPTSENNEISVDFTGYFSDDNKAVKSLADKMLGRLEQEKDTPFHSANAKHIGADFETPDVPLIVPKTWIPPITTMSELQFDQKKNPSDDLKDKK